MLFAPRTPHLCVRFCKKRTRRWENPPVVWFLRSQGRRVAGLRAAGVARSAATRPQRITTTVAGFATPR